MMQRAPQLANEGESTRSAHSYRASRFWTATLICAPIFGFGGFSLMFILDLSSGDIWGLGLPIFLGVSFCLVLLAYFLGNLSVLWPYAVDVDPHAGLVLHGPLRKLSIPISDVGDVEDSLFWQGYVVHLTRPRAALTQFIIPWYFGAQRGSLIRAIRLASLSQSEGVR